MVGPYYAHSLPGKPVAEWQPLEEYLKNVAQLARRFADAFGAGELAWIVGWLRDLKKNCNGHSDTEANST